jgi:hypothetical protein
MLTGEVFYNSLGSAATRPRGSESRGDDLCLPTICQADDSIASTHSQTHTWIPVAREVVSCKDVATDEVLVVA